MAEADRPAARQPGRVVAVDLGAARVGVAVSDSARSVASPRQVLYRSGDPVRDRAAIGRVVEEEGATLLVVGLPLGLDGTKGPAAQAALEEVAALRADLGGRLGIEVVAVDERLSTAEAQRRRVEAVQAHDRARRGGRGGRSGPARPGAPAKRARPVVDDAAAALFLQGFLDRLHAEGDASAASGRLGAERARPGEVTT